MIWAPELDAELMELVAEGHRWNAIGKRFGCHFATPQNRFWKLAYQAYSKEQLK